MLQTSLEREYKLRFNVRPIKIAYFVWEDDWTALEQALSLSCTQWGGIRNLIIPVKRSLEIAPLFNQILTLCEPDWFVAYLLDDPPRTYRNHDTLRSLLQKSFPKRQIELQVGDSFERVDYSAHALSPMTDEFLRSKPLRLRRLASDDAPRWLNLALFGEIHSGQSEVYSNSLSLQEKMIKLGSTEFWESQFSLDPFSSPLNLTGYGIKPFEATDGGVDSIQFELVFVNSLVSLCLFWSLRAVRDSLRFISDKEFGRRIFLCPSSLIADGSSIGTFVEFARRRIPYPNIETNLHFRLYTDGGEAKRELHEWLIASSDLQEFSEPTISEPHHFGATRPKEDLSGKKLTYLSMKVQLPRSYREGFGVRLPDLVKLMPGDNELLLQPPFGFHNRLGGSVAVDIICDIWERYVADNSVASSIINGGWFSKYGMTMNFNLNNHPTFFKFNLPTDWNALELFLKSRKYTIKTSRAGQYAEAVVNLLGGLDKSPLISSKEVSILFDMLALKSTKKVAQRISKEIASEDQIEKIEHLLADVLVIPELKGIPKTYRQLSSDEKLKPYRANLLEILSKLTAANILKRGFYLPCPNCGTPDWYSLQALSEQVTCTGCGEIFIIPVESPKGTELQWEYRLNTLVNRAVDQDVLIHAVALNRLVQQKETSANTLGLEVLTDDQASAELDFAFVSQQKLFAGECKAGAELGQKDLETAYLAARLGVSKFYFCTARNFSEGTLISVENLRDRLKSESLSMGIETLNLFEESED